MTTVKDARGAGLRQQLDEQQQKSRARFPPAAAIMRQATVELVRSGIVERSLPVGMQARDFALPNARGETVRLLELLARGPVVLAFYLWLLSQVASRPHSAVALQGSRQASMMKRRRLTAARVGFGIALALTGISCLYAQPVSRARRKTPRPPHSSSRSACAHLN